MSLWDVDKTGDKREKPVLNHNDGLMQRRANSTTSVHPVTDSTPSSAYTQTKDGRILVNDGTTNRVLVGALPDGTFGMKVSQAAYDVTAATDSQLIFNSSQNMFKIVATGTATIPTSGTSTASVSVAHGLSYIPAFVAYVFISATTSYNTIPLVNINTSTGVILSEYIGWSDATNINFQVIVPGGTVPSTTPVKYYLLQETAI